MKKLLKVVLLGATIFTVGFGIKDSIQIEKKADAEITFSTSSNQDPGTGTRP